MMAMIRLLAGAALIVGCIAAAEAAEPVTVIVPPGGIEEAAKLVDSLRGTGATVVVRFADGGEDRTGSGGAPKAGGAGASPPASLAALFSAGLRRGLEAIPAIPPLLGDAAAAWSARRNSAGGVGLTWLAALLAGLAVHRALRGWTPAVAPDRLAGRLAHAVAGLARDLAAIAALTATGALAADLLRPEPDFARAVATEILSGAAVSLLYLAGGRFLLAPGAPQWRLLPLERAERHYAALVIYGVADQLINATVDLGLACAADGRTVHGWFLLADTALTIFTLWWFWDMRGDVSRLVRAGAADPAAPTVARRATAAVAPWILMAITALMWAVGRIAAVAPNGVRWGFASEITQVLVVIAPIAASGCAMLLRNLLAPAPDADRPSARAFAAIAATAAAGAVWLGGFVLLARLWSFFLSDDAVAGVAQALLEGTDDATVLAVGFLTWSFTKVLFDSYGARRAALPPSGYAPSDQPAAPHSRLATVLPLLRGVALSTVAAVTLLVFLSRLGVDIGPLLAGAGVIGLAISFGSQALVRDIVSGIFFMTDDAFRVGEYIDTGRLKGVVEKLSLRSMLLRHQSGQLHTVPYGQIASVTNASRDWATVKFNIPLAHGVDLDRVRKLVKKVGQQLLGDAELGPEFIQPLKLQGMAQITGDGLVIRLKFTARPAKASWLQREALRRTYETLVEAGVAFPAGTVAMPGAPAVGVAATR